LRQPAYNVVITVLTMPELNAWEQLQLILLLTVRKADATIAATIVPIALMVVAIAPTVLAAVPVFA